MTIGTRVRRRREELGMSQEELAHRIGYKDKTSIHKIESDKQQLRQTKIKAIADALETTTDYIMGWYDYEAEKVLVREEPISREPTVPDHALRLFSQLDQIDQERIIERMETMLESDKYQKESLTSAG